MLKSNPFNINYTYNHRKVIHKEFIKKIILTGILLCVTEKHTNNSHDY